MSDLDDLEAKARAASGDIAVAIDTTTAGDETYEAVVVTTSGDTRALAAHVAAANPAAVLELIERLRAAEAAVMWSIAFRCPECLGYASTQPSAIEHAPSCAQRRAVEASK